MIAEVHLHSPAGVPTQRQVADICDMLYRDNMMWIAGRVNSGLPVPECAKAMGVQYRPPMGAEKSTPKQTWLAGPYMMDAGRGSCCDIGPYDAAALTLLYKIQSRPIVPHQGGTSYHCNVLTPWGVYDPTMWWSDPNYRLPPLSWGPMQRQQYVQKLVQEGGRNAT